MHQENSRRVQAEDGSWIAYEVIGQQGPVVVLCNGYATTHFYWRHVIAHLSQRARVVTWDYRGHGNSGPSRTLEGLTMAQIARDIGSILDHMSVERAILFGFSFGCQVVFEAWRQMPERVEALAAFFGTFEHPFDHVFHPRVGPTLFRIFERIAERVAERPMRLMGKMSGLPIGYRVGQLTGMIEWNIPAHEMRPFFEHYKVLHVPSWVAMGRAAQAHSAGDVLSTIDVPTLIVSGGKDSWTPSHMSARMSEVIPASHHVHLPRATHTALLGHAPEVVRIIDDFMRDEALLRV